VFASAIFASAACVLSAVALGERLAKAPGDFGGADDIDAVYTGYLGGFLSLRNFYRGSGVGPFGHVGFK